MSSDTPWLQAKPYRIRVLSNANFTSSVEPPNPTHDPNTLKPPIQHQSAQQATSTMTLAETVKDAVHDLKEAVVGTQLSNKEMADARLPIAYRDKCAHLLVPLNRCRYDTYYMPWKCEDERHSYEKCQYIEFKRRVAKMDELKAEKGGRSGLN